MILRILILVLALGSNLTSPLFAACERGDFLIAETGGVPGASPGVPILLDFSDFFALMPNDNTGAGAFIPIGAPIPFPQTGSTNGVIVRTGGVSSSTTFVLPAIGTYLIEFQASVANGFSAGQLELSVNGVPLASSVVGRDTGTDQIVGISLLTTTTPNTTISVINPPTATAALQLTTIAGGTHPVSAHLVIIRIL